MDQLTEEFLKLDRYLKEVLVIIYIFPFFYQNHTSWRIQKLRLHH